MKQFKLISLLLLLLCMGSGVMAQPNSGSVLPTGKKFYIQSAMNYGRNNGGYWDIPGRSSMINKGTNIQVWDLDNGPDREFTLVKSPEQGYYEIHVGDTKNSRIDVAHGRKNNGTNIGVWEKNNQTCQRFLFKHLGNGRFKIYTKMGTMICLNARENKNGTNVHTWEDHNGIFTEWFLIDAQTKKAFVPRSTVKTQITPLKGYKIPHGEWYIQSAMSYGRSNKGYIELPGGVDRFYRSGNQLAIWEKNNNPNKVFVFEKDRNSAYYTIYCGGERYKNNKTPLVVDLKAGKAVKGTPAHAWTKHNGDSQQFFLKYLGNGRFKICPKTGGVLCLKDNKTDNNRNKVHVWDDHNAITTEWFLINKQTGKAYKP